MKFKNSTALLSISFAALTAAPALADITADDIWNSYQEISKTVGGELTATPSRDGNKVKFTAPKLHFTLPITDRPISVDLLYPTLSYINNTDGTVSMDLNGKQIYKLVVTGPAPENDGISVEFAMTYQDAKLIASGTPNDITYSYNVGRLDFSLLDIVADGIPQIKDLPHSIMGHASDMKGSSRITLGELLSIINENETASMGYATEKTDAKGIQTNTTYSYGDMKNQGVISLPTGGMSVMNLAAALEQGLSLQGSSRVSATGAQTTAVLNDQEVMSILISGGPATSNVSANSDAIDLAANFADTNLDLAITAEIPLAFKTDIGKTGFHFRLPLSASEDPQNFTLALNLEGMEFGESIWAQFDPAQVLPRDSASISADLTGQTTLFQDLMNFTKMMELTPGEAPLELNSLTINDLLVSAAGASLTGAGDFTFNNDDLISFDGIPAPSGSADLQITGFNGLIDKVIQMGLVEESDAMGVRMMMGMFTVVGDGEDTLNSKLEISENGQIHANGQRIK